jgi:hypothetical protein
MLDACAISLYGFIIEAARLQEDECGRQLKRREEVRLKNSGEDLIGFNEQRSGVKSLSSTQVSMIKI